MKKRLFALILMGIMTLTACSGNEQTTTTTTTTVATTEPTTTTTEAASEPTTSEDSSAEDTSGGNTAPEDNAEQTEAQRLAEFALNSIEFPSMVAVTDPETLSTVMQLDSSDFADYGIYMQMISVHLEEIIVVEPVEGKMDAVLEQLNVHKDALINNFAFYPDQLEAAQATIVGSKGKYAYLICDINAQTVVDALLAEIG